MKNVQPLSAEGGTSPRRGRPRGFDLDEALGIATLLFWKRGYDGTSISDLTAAIGIEAPSLYAAFGSKRALFEKALQHYGGAYERFVWQRFFLAPTARAATEAYLADSAAALSGSVLDVPTGCMTVLSSMNDEAHPEIGELLRAARGMVFDRLADRYEQGVADGEIPWTCQVRSLARFIQDVQTGMSTLARDGVGRDELQQVAEIAMRGWDGWVATGDEG